MALSLPSAPIVGEEYRDWIWDGNRWLVMGDGARFVPEAPADGELYVRRGSDRSWQLLLIVSPGFDGGVF
jgi:hypothetical protein